MERNVSFISGCYQLAGCLHYPKEGVFPGIVICHGFKDHKDKPFYINLAQTLEKSGFSVLRFDFTGSGVSEGLFEDISIRQEVMDVGSAVTYMMGLPEVDRSRIGVCGISLGGMVSIIQATSNPTIRVLASLCPAIDRRYFMERYEREGRVRYYDNYFVLDGLKIKTAFIKDASIEIYQYAPKLRIPFLLIHGTSDQSCLVKHSVKFSLAVDSNKEVHIISGAEHMFPKQEVRQSVFNTTTNWFIRSL